MDLKFSHGKILVHIIDHCTRLLASTVISNKNPDTIIKAIFKIWISVYGSAEKFLTDNDSFIQLCENFGITVKTTATESTWRNGLVERHILFYQIYFIRSYMKTTVTLTLLLLGLSMRKTLSVTSMDVNYQLCYIIISWMLITLLIINWHQPKTTIFTFI